MTFQRFTETGLRLLAKNGTAVQEVYIVAPDRQAALEWLAAEGIVEWKPKREGEPARRRDSAGTAADGYAALRHALRRLRAGDACGHTGSGAGPEADVYAHSPLRAQVTVGGRDDPVCGCADYRLRPRFTSDGIATGGLRRMENVSSDTPILESFEQWKQFLSDRVKEFKRTGASQQTITNMATSIGNFLAEKVDPATASSGC